MFARAGAAGATGAWNDCTKVVARTCHKSGSGKGSAQARPVAAQMARQRFVRLLRASTLLPSALPCRLRPRGALAGPAAPRACMFSGGKLSRSVAIYIYPASMRAVVSSLALCGVSSAYQATTARPGALANQVTMMAKSKARPRSLTQPAAAPRLPGLRRSCSHRAALVDRSRRCSMRLRGSRATLERRTASIRSACPTLSTWCASAPPAQLTRDAMLGVSAVHCALCRGSWVVPPVRPI